jgi:hypothetical protein
VALLLRLSEKEKAPKILTGNKTRIALAPRGFLNATKHYQVWAPDISEETIVEDT